MKGNQNMPGKNKGHRNQRRCNHCVHWKWEYTNIYGIGEGRCDLHNSYPDAPDPACENFLNK